MNEGWIKTTCAYCGVGCGVEARPTSDGRLDVRGDKEHPSNYGKLCTKGIALGDTVIHDGRLLTPKLKQDDTTWRDMDWKEAISTVAEGFCDIVEKHGPDAVAFYVSGQLLTEDYYVANKLIKGFIGTANIDSNSRLCMASSVVGHKRAFGMDTVPVCYEDLDMSDLVVLVGSNLAWCHPVLFQRLRAAKQVNPKMKVVVIDPRRNESCDIADIHLALNSGSDVALYNGLLQYLDGRGYLDRTFIESNTAGFEHALMAAKNEENVADITGIECEQLDSFYALFAETEKVMTVYSQGVNQSSQGSDKVSSIINCHLATGKIGKVGSGPFSVTGQPNAMGGREVGALANTLAAHMEFDNEKDVASVQSFWQTDTLAKTPGLKAIDMFDAIYSGKIKAVWIMATNPVVSLPDSEKIKQALQICPLVVVSDCIEHTATTQYADILLPAQGWSEKSGTVTNSERRISRQRRLLSSPGLARPDWWIISRVAQEMGYQEHFNFLHEGEVFKEYAALTTIGNRECQRDLNLLGLTNLTDMEYHTLTPQQWPVIKKQEAITHQRMFEDHQFYTHDKKAHFVPIRYSAPKASISNDFPLVLNSGRTRDHWHTMTRTGLSSKLAEHTPEPYVLIHPITADRHQLTDGQLATVYNNNGECIVKVAITETIKSSDIFIPIHWNEITAPLSKPCVLIDARIDAFSGQPEFKYTPVGIKPYEYKTSAIVIVREPIHLKGIGYFARQKVGKGYLYRIRSFLDRHVLEHRIESTLDFGQVKGKTLWRYESESKVRVTIYDQRVESLYITENVLRSNDEIESLMSIFNEPIDDHSSVSNLMAV